MHLKYLKESGLVSDTFEIPLMMTDEPSVLSALAPAQPRATATNSKVSKSNRSQSEAEADNRSFPFGSTLTTLSAFVGGDENRLVTTALENLLAQPNNPFNPLVLCGRSGIGKSLLARCLASHWMNARLGNTADSQYKNARVVVMTGDDWARGYVQAVRNDNIAAWRQRFRSSAIFVLDDLPQLLRQSTAQRELVLLLDDLTDAGVPIIATTPLDPNACDGIDPSLASRLSGGLVLQLQPPGTDARQRIISQLTKSYPRQLSPEAKQWFAELFPGSVPALQQSLMGCLSRIGREGQVSSGSREKSRSTGEISRQELRRLHADWMKHQSVSLKSITKSVSRYCQIPVKEMTGSSRRHSIVQARSLAMFLAKQLSGQSLRSIGHHFGGRDHTTVLHACQKIKSNLTSEPTLRMAIDELTQILRGPN